MSEKYGKVYLAGSGPGDPDLLTVKARRLIDEADVVIYDQLPGEAILSLIPEKTEKIDAGKYSGNHTLTQDKINEAIIEKAKEGKTVLRLKGGDPYVFGRGGEEAEELVKVGIEFEVVPGITSAVAAPAYAGIPVTHRNSNSMVTFITGHEDPTKEETGLDWELLAKFDGTLVIFMGVKMLERNCGELLKYGMDPKTPVALVEKGTRPDQRVTIGKLENIAALAEERNVKAPAITIIGNVVNLHDILGEQHSNY
ncbi:Uroporphyrinogen-III C-methyltransferase [Methanimicrococcus hongohii]|uniref:uroporphyrinogen-III C-methyltransferase n=1 Tax=Methanimicrococcus hongohii TaxID=3028295 RepID=A0AA96ZTF9_9EURY|nr:uroporphyrinogen-III C-methyltransferase [Methanimicrococcus sp. Hf6]WNY23181.1 Uroporphyrinogen-III C-methyltransferase [Methanimicrococcus sp. Hf6]